MKVPERLLGFVNYDEKEIAFEFDSEKFLLNLYPSKELWEKYSSLSYAFSKPSFDYRKHEWIPEKRLFGKTSLGQLIIFSVQSDSSLYHGFISFSVNWYFCCYDGMNENNIYGFYVEGDVVNAFYSPQNALEQHWEFDEQSGIKKMAVTSANVATCSCGSYTITEGITAEIEVDAYATYVIGDTDVPMFGKSRLNVNFNNPTTLDIVLQVITHVLRFLMFVTYRANVHPNQINLCIKQDEDKRNYLGMIVFPNEKNVENNKDAKQHLIKYSYLKENVAKIFKMIKEESISFRHICENYESKKTYPISRVIMIMAAFERVYGCIYGKDTDRSEVYIETKAKVVSIIEEYASSCTGKSKKYAKTLKDYVNNRDSSFASNVKFALKDCRDIMMPFVLRRYEGDYEEIVDNLGERAGVIRNGVAHCKLDFSLEAIHLTDIHIMEELQYAIILKYIGMDVHEIQKSIGKLFKENIAFQKKET